MTEKPCYRLGHVAGHCLGCPQHGRHLNRKNEENETCESRGFSLRSPLTGTRPKTEFQKNLCCNSGYANAMHDIPWQRNPVNSAAMSCNFDEHMGDGHLLNSSSRTAFW